MSDTTTCSGMAAVNIAAKQTKSPLSPPSLRVSRVKSAQTALAARDDEHFIINFGERISPDNLCTLLDLSKPYGIREVEALQRLLLEDENSTDLWEENHFLGGIAVTKAFFDEFRRVESAVQIIPLAEAVTGAVDYLPINNGGACVYFLFAGESLLYIGKTLDILSRTYSHKRNKRFDSVYYKTTALCDLELTELLNIRHHRPPLNRKIPRNVDIFITILRTAITNCRIYGQRS